MHFCDKETAIIYILMFSLWSVGLLYLTLLSSMCGPSGPSPSYDIILSSCSMPMRAVSWVLRGGAGRTSTSLSESLPLSDSCMAGGWDAFHQDILQAKKTFCVHQILLFRFWTLENNCEPTRERVVTLLFAGIILYVRHEQILIKHASLSWAIRSSVALLFLLLFLLVILVMHPPARR